MRRLLAYGPLALALVVLLAACGDDDGGPATGTPTAGTLATGTPATGTPGTGTPATGTPAIGTPAATPAATAVPGEATTFHSPRATLPLLPTWLLSRRSRAWLAETGCGRANACSMSAAERLPARASWCG